MAGSTPQPGASEASAIQYVRPESLLDDLENADRRLGAALGVPPASATLALNSLIGKIL